MTSAKKRRGRERKAARKKENNGGGRTVSTNDGGVVGGGIDINNSAAVLVEGVRMGSNKDTGIAFDVYQGVPAHLRPSLIRLGLLDIILDYLGRCNASFDSVMRDIGGDLQTPVLWIDLLLSPLTHSNECHSQIIDSIGPLVSCMCDDVERKFFGSKKYWHEAILPFMEIIYKMLDLESNFIQLSQHEGLFETIVQWGFWQFHRPDIFNELKAFISTSDVTVTDVADIMGNVHILGEEATFRLIEWARQNDDAKNMLGDIGSVPIVSRAYDPNCKVSLVGGMIRYMKINLKKSGDRRRYFQALNLLVHLADCVDKDVITEMIDCGRNFTSGYNDADVITRLVCSMITRKIDNGNAQPNDSRTAFAIRAGLLDMCMDMIARFGGVQNARGILPGVALILRNIYLLSFHKKTSKAIGAKRGHFLEEFERLKENKQVANGDSNACTHALITIQSIIDITSTCCFVCNKETERKDMKKCAACKSICYCSEECQRKDWRSGGHDCDCESFIGGKCKLQSPLCSNEREAAKLKDLERNIMMAQKDLFLGHAETIREQLAAKQSPQSEYIVHFDLCQFPLAVTVLPYTEYFFSNHKKKWFEESMLLDDVNIMCVYQSPFFNCKPDTPNSVILILFPLGWLSQHATKCSGTQRSVEEKC